jgi:hypothetical protein
MLDYRDARQSLALRLVLIEQPAPPRMHRHRSRQERSGPHDQGVEGGRNRMRAVV